MARVPTRDNFQVLPGGGGSGRVRSNATGLGGVQGANVQQLGAAVQRAGSIGSQIVEAEQDRLNQARVREAALSFRSDMAAAEQEYEQFKGAELVAGDKPIMRDIEARMDARRNELLSGLSSQDAQAAFEAVSSEMSNSWRNRAAAYEAKQADFYVDQQRDGMIQAQIETAISSPDKRATSLSEASSVLREKFEDQGFDGDRLNQKTQEAMGQLLAGQLDALIESGSTQDARDVLEAGADYLSSDDASRMKTAIKNKEIEGYTLAITEGRIDQQMINEMHANGEIDDGDKVRLTAQRDRYEAREEAERKAQETERQKVNFERLRVAIDDGIMGREDADQALESGSINISQWSQAARLANDAKGRQSASASFAESLQLGLPIDPRDSETKKGANALFQASGGKALFAEDFDLGLSQTRQFAQAGIIPDDAQTVLSGYVSSGTPDQQKMGLTAIGDLYASAPNAVNAAFNDNQLSDAISYTHKVNAGVDENAAYEALLVEREARANPDSAHKALIDKARKLSGDFTLDDALKRRDADGKRGFGPFWNDGTKVGSDAKSEHVDDPLVEAQIVQDFQNSFEGFYALHGDEGLAKRQAAAVMGRTVGRSGANGNRAMMHPPEHHYVVGADDDGQWMRDSLQAMFEPRYGGFADIELISDGQTAREVRDGVAPSYAVILHEKSGAINPLQVRVDFVDEYRTELERKKAEVHEKESEKALKKNSVASTIAEREELERARGDDVSRNPFQRDPFQVGARVQSGEQADQKRRNIERDRQRLEGEDGSY